MQFQSPISIVVTRFGGPFAALFAFRGPRWPRRVDGASAGDTCLC
jgi:hypothetical protein